MMTPSQYGSAAGLLIVLIAVALGLNADWLRERFFDASVPKIDSIAILPLKNLSGDPEQDYLSDGRCQVNGTKPALLRKAPASPFSTHTSPSSRR